MDDDVYVIMDNLVKLLSKMDPKIEARYIGKSIWKQPLSVSCCLYITVTIMKISYYNYNGIFSREKIIKFSGLHFIFKNFIL